MKKDLTLTRGVLSATLFWIATPLFADVTVIGINTPPPGAPPSYQTSVDGNIVVAPTGIITPPANNDGVIVDSAAASVVVAANNVNVLSPPNAILTSGTGVGINVVGGGTNSTITINSGSNVRATGSDAIRVGDTLLTLTNSGGIFGGESGIEILSTGATANITNMGGTIQGTTDASVLIDAGGSGLTLTNSPSLTIPAVAGTISATGIQNAIEINGDFTSITNNAGGIITSVNGDTISIESPASGDIQNSGSITVTGAANAVAVYAPYNGSITNNSGGLIQNTEAADAVGGAIFLNSSFNSLNNNAGGVISALGPNSGFLNNNYAIRLESAPGTVNNAGTIQTDQGIAYLLEGTGSTGLVNSGLIIATNPAVGTIVAGAVGSPSLPDGIINTGIITSGNARPAIDLQQGLANVPLFQEGGAINGDVLLSSGGGTVLTMTGGTINGNVSSSLINASTLNFDGGSVNGTVTIRSINNTINIAGTDLQTIQSASGLNTYNITGGSFDQLIGNIADVANVNATFTLSGTISNVPTINVNNSGTVFTVNNTISGISNQLLISSGAQMIANAGPAGVSGTGALTIQNGGRLDINNGSSVDMGSANNSGFLAISNNAALNLTGSYTQSGAFAPTISDLTPTGFGVIHVGTTATFNPGATFNPQLGTSGVFIPDGAVFPVVQTGAGVIGFNNITVVQPPSAILSFMKRLDGNNVDLVAQNKPLPAVALPDIPLAIAEVLQALLPTTNPELLAFLGQLQLLPDIQSVSAALLQLAPSFNYMLPASSQISMNNAFNSAHARLESMTRLGLLVDDENYREHRDYELYNGVNYGDRNIVTLGTGAIGIWAKAYATVLEQHKRHYIEGYKAKACGFAFGGDWSVSNFATFGIGQSFTDVRTTDKTDQQNSVNVKSIQTTFYGWIAPYQVCQPNALQTVYVELMLALASHKYETTRNIALGTFAASATADFFGWHYGAQMDIGYAFISSDNYLVAPLARFRFTYLDIDTYTETGAGGLDLTVRNDDIDEAIAGLGIRLAWVKNYIQAVYVPEVSVVLLYDFAGQNQEIQSTFMAGGNPFFIDGIRPAQFIQEYGLGITAYTSDGYAFTIQGNFQHRDHFYGYYGYMQLTYDWA